MRTGMRQSIVALAVFAAGFPALLPAQDGSAPGLDAMAVARVVIGLLVVLLVILALGWTLRRMGAVTGSAAGQLRVLGGVSLGNRERAVLVQVGEEQLLIGVSPGRVCTLHKLPKPLEAAGSGPGARGGGEAPQGFAARLQQLMHQDAGRRSGSPPA